MKLKPIKFFEQWGKLRAGRNEFYLVDRSTGKAMAFHDPARGMAVPMVFTREADAIMAISLAHNQPYYKLMTLPYSTRLQKEIDHFLGQRGIDVEYRQPTRDQVEAALQDVVHWAGLVSSDHDVFSQQERGHGTRLLKEARAALNEIQENRENENK